MVTVLLVEQVWCGPNWSTLKSVLLMHSKTSAGVLDCKERTTQGLTGERSRYVALRLHAWLSGRSWHDNVQDSNSPPGLWPCPPGGWCWFPLAGFQGFWFLVWSSSSWRAVVTKNQVMRWSTEERTNHLKRESVQPPRRDCWSINRLLRSMKYRASPLFVPIVSFSPHNLLWKSF